MLLPNRNNSYFPRDQKKKKRYRNYDQNSPSQIHFFHLAILITNSLHQEQLVAFVGRLNSMSLSHLRGADPPPMPRADQDVPGDHHAEVEGDRRIRYEVPNNGDRRNERNNVTPTTTSLKTEYLNWSLPLSKRMGIRNARGVTPCNTWGATTQRWQGASF